MRRSLAIALTLACFCGTVSAKEIYVDNLIGQDSFDGRFSKPFDGGSGPVRTLHRAMKLAGYADQIVLTRPGAVYYDSLALTGRRNSGTVQNPFTIIGNGAILSGLRAVPPEGWRQAGPDLWKLTLTRKGYYRLMRDGISLPESIPEPGAAPLRTLQPGEWTAWQGSLYFKADGDSPATQSFTYTAEQTGLSLYQVDNVRIVDLTLRDFRFDGLHAQNMCEGVRLENVTCVNNGRAGIAVSGTSHVEIVGGRVIGNGRHQLRIAGRAGAELRDLAIDGEPTVVP